MPDERLGERLRADLDAMADEGRLKGRESVIRAVVPPRDGRGPRYLLEGERERPFLRMNSNGYLGLALDPEVIAAEEEAVRRYGTGPGAVRFISGTWAAHSELERRLAAFHGREAAMIFSSAYATVMGVLPPLITGETAVVSDELNHNCIINAMRLARPKEKRIYAHGDTDELDAHLTALRGTCHRVIVVTDGIFSMRGDHAPLAAIIRLARAHDAHFPENVLVMVDDSHGVGAFGAKGRGVEEHEGAEADLLVATLGKALGVNGGYVAARGAVIDYLRETAPLYVYSNPITPGEAAAAAKAIDVLDSPRGATLLAHLGEMTARFRDGLTAIGEETIPGAHPVVPLMTRDTGRTRALVAHLYARGVLATGLAFPVVPRGEEEIRFQLSADHTPADVDEALDAIRDFAG